MAVNRTAVQFVYGLGDALIQLPPQPILANRAPSTSDLAQLGTLWINVPSAAVYTLASITSNSANWTTSAGSGVGDFTEVTINPGDLTVTAGNASIGGNLAVTGDVTVDGTLTATNYNISTPGVIDFESTSDTNPAINISVDGGTSSTIVLYNASGTADGSIQLLSDLGGVELTSSRATDGSINLNALAGGVYINAAGKLEIVSSQGNADSFVLDGNNGGIEMNADLGVAVTCNGLFTIDAQDDSVASPTAAVTLNVNVGQATFTGFTTAAAASQVFTITNSLIDTDSKVIVTACNEGSNDAQMTVMRVKRLSGSMEVTLKNNGAAALNGNVGINFWVLATN
jgi:hypothetical protein